MAIVGGARAFVTSRKMYPMLFFCSLFYYTLFNQAIPFTDPVESNYVLTAKEMVLSADWLSPRIYGNVWFDKPVFFYWLIAAAFQVWGFSEWAARLAPALFAAIGLVALYWFTKKITKPTIALLAVIVMGTSIEYIILAKMVITDMVFFVFNCAALVSFYLGYIDRSNTKRWYLAMYVGMALAVLTKGPAGILLPGLVVVLFIGIQRDWAELKRLVSPSGMLLFAALTLPWYGAMYALYGTEFIDNFFGVHNYLRATVSEHPQDNVVYYYIGVFVIGMLPWSVLAAKALLQSCRSWHSRRSPLLLYLLVWIAAYVGFYSLMATKYLTYTFPVFFPTAILTAIQLERMLAQNKAAALFCWAGVPVLLVMGGYLLAAHRYQAAWEAGCLAIACLLLVSFFFVWKSQDKGSAAMFKLLCLCQLGSYVVLSLFVLPAMAETRSGKGLAKSMSSFAGAKIGIYQHYSTSAVFYSGNNLVKLTAFDKVSEEPTNALDWSSKYTMPTQSLPEFLRHVESSGTVIIVLDQHKELFLLEAANFNCQLLKNDRGISYYFITGRRVVKVEEEGR